MFVLTLLVCLVTGCCLDALCDCFSLFCMITMVVVGSVVICGGFGLLRSS